MTISTGTVVRVSFAGDGTTTAFALGASFVFFDDTDLVVTLVTDSTGAEAVQTLTTDYTVTGGGGSTGTVTMITAPAVGETLVVSLNLPFAQGSDLVNNDKSDAEVVEDALDKLTLLSRQIDDALNRMFRLSDANESASISGMTDPEDTRKDKLLGWSSDGKQLANLAAADANLVTLANALTAINDLTDGAAGKILRYTATNAAELLDVMEVANKLTAETAPATGDEVGIYDASASAGRKMTLQNMLKVINLLTELTTGDPEADFLLAYDTSANNVRRIKPQNLSPNAGKLRNTQIFTTGNDGAGAYTKPSWLKFAIVEVVGGGGSGASCIADGIGSGAGAGGYAREKIAAGSIGSTEDVSVGAGGAAPSAGNNNGNAGGSSSFGTSAFLSATGGSGGVSTGVSGNGTDGSPGGTGSGGDLNFDGGDGGSSDNSAGSGRVGGSGGSSYFSGNTRGRRNNNGETGKYPGGGGSGAGDTTTTARTGGAGADGIVIVHEYE